MRLGLTVDLVIEVPDDAVQAVMEKRRLRIADLSVGHFGTLTLSEPTPSGAKLLFYETVGEVEKLKGGS